MTQTKTTKPPAKKVDARTAAKAAGAKMPADHKPKEADDEDIEFEFEFEVERSDDGWSVTYEGLTVFVEIGALDDFELMDDLTWVQRNKNLGRMPSILQRIVGDQYRDVLDKMRDADTGRVSLAKASQFTMALFGELNPNS